MIINKKLEDQIILTAYNDVNIFTQLKIYLLIAFNKDARKLYKEFRKTKKTINKIKKEEYAINVKLPSYVSYKKPSFFTDIYCLFTSKPLVPVMYAAVIALAIFLSVLFKNRVVTTNNNRLYTKTEINQANLQAKYAIALVGNLLKETNTTIKNEIIKKQVSEPLTEGLNIINNILN
jgi:hypothetical protein